MRGSWPALIFLSVVLAGCATTAPQYFVGDIDDQDIHDLQKDPVERIYGRWLSADTLEVTLLFGVSDASVLPKESLKAEVVGDVVQLHVAEENDRSRDPNAPVALCITEKKLTYILRGLRSRPDKVHVFLNLYGTDYAWDIKPLLIRN